jgi:hypothetical protein
MLFKETNAVNCEKHTEHTDTLCGQNAEFWYVKAVGTYSNHWALRGWHGLLSQGIVISVTGSGAVEGKDPYVHIEKNTICRSLWLWYVSCSVYLTTPVQFPVYYYQMKTNDMDGYIEYFGKMKTAYKILLGKPVQKETTWET